LDDTCPPCATGAWQPGRGAGGQGTIVVVEVLVEVVVVMEMPVVAVVDGPVVVVLDVLVDGPVVVVVLVVGSAPGPKAMFHALAWVERAVMRRSPSPRISTPTRHGSGTASPAVALGLQAGISAPLRNISMPSGFRPGGSSAASASNTSTSGRSPGSMPLGGGKRAVRRTGGLVDRRLDVHAGAEEFPAGHRRRDAAA
jgi:hypothetical protein